MEARFLPLPLCGACPFVGYCGLFSINYFRKKKRANMRASVSMLVRVRACAGRCDVRARACACGRPGARARSLPMATLPGGGPAEDGSELRSHACGVAKVRPDACF
jgi:hypothetical protein